ncbi:MAG: phosphate signaling complex protein PhoU [Promethearchaeota archaeon]|nr:MAG: phosphate signaling complex protein PhoU [Candidatus Lokiarchaeota archaeon]
MVKEFHKALKDLKEYVLEMAHFSLGMLDDAVSALISRELELANNVDKRKDKLRDYDEKIENRSLKIIALYQPMAIDLRVLGAILKIITYLYRIGRYGKDIAAIVDMIQTKYPLSELTGIKHMWEHVKPMINDAIEAFDEAKIDKLKDFEIRDDEVDKMRWSIFRESISYMIEDPKNITVSSHLIMVARYLERCGDHACKIAEKVHYMVTGKHIEIS